MSNKSEEPTESRLRQARQDGQTSKSKDLTQALTACIWSAMLVLLFFPAVGAALQILRNMIDLIAASAILPDQLLAHATDELLLPAGLMMLGVAIAGVVIAVMLEQLQVRGLLSAKPVTPNFNKMNPAKQLKSIFSLKTVVELIKNLLKVVVIVVTTIAIIRSYFSDALQLFWAQPLDALTIVAHMLCWLGLCSQGALLMMAMVDIQYQKYEYKRGLKMTKDEVRRDYKQQQGDPDIRNARRQLQAGLAHERSK